MREPSPPTPPDASDLAGVPRAADESSALFERLRAELHELARGSLRKHGPAHTLQTTALVNEAWMRLSGVEDAEYADREHFLAVAARAMRFVLVDHARSRGREKRGGGHERLPIEIALEQYEERAVDVVELSDALDELATRNERQSRIVELRFFGGLTNDETAAVLDVSVATVERDWRMARLYLLSTLGAG